LSGRVIHYPVGSDIIRLEVSGISKLKSDIVQVKLDIIWWEVSGKHVFLLKSTPFFLNLILEQYDTKSDETWTQGSPQYKEQVSKRVFFLNPMIPLPILDELKNLGFKGTRRNS
jgi:hypothetical protein